MEANYKSSYLPSRSISLEAIFFKMVKKSCIVGDSQTFVFLKWECYPLYYLGRSA